MVLMVVTSDGWRELTDAELQPMLRGEPRWLVANSVITSRAAQGRPPKVTDPAVLRQVVTLLTGS